VFLATEKKRSAGSDRPRVKRTKHIKQPKKQPIHLDVKTHVDTSNVKVEEFHNSQIKQERAQSEPSNIPYIKEEVEEVIQNITPPISPSSPLSLPLPPVPSPPSIIPISNLIEEESIKTNLNAIKLEPCSPINTDLLEIKEEIQTEPTKMEPIKLTADEIRKAEEGQAAAAMLLEQMSDVEEKYNPSLTPPLPPPLPSPPKNISNSKYSPPNFRIKREFHPEDMLTSTVQSTNIE